MNELNDIWLLAVLSQAGQHVRYASGRLVAAMSRAYAGEGKTQCRWRPDNVDSPGDLSAKPGHPPFSRSGVQANPSPPSTQLTDP